MQDYCEYQCEECNFGICSDFERDLHLVVQGKKELTVEQREQCYREITAVEGYSYSEAYLNGLTNEELANETFSAWNDYSRDKGLY